MPLHAAHLGKRVISYCRDGPSERITLQFSDGSAETCDVLVGCDGINSTIRRRMFEDKAAAGHQELLKHIKPRWSGWVAYRALVPSEKLTDADGGKHTALLKPMIVSSQPLIFV